MQADYSLHLQRTAYCLYTLQARSRQVVEGLRASAAFREMSARELALIACGGKSKRLPRYAVLYREGAAAHSFYILVSG